MKTHFLVIFAIMIPILIIFGCGEDEEEEDVIQLINTDPPEGEEIGALGTLTMTFDGEPATVTVDTPGGSKSAKVDGKDAIYTFTKDDSLVTGNEVPIGISWVSKDGSKGSKIVRLKIIAGGDGIKPPPVVDIESWKNVTLVSSYEGDFGRLALSPDDPFLALTTHTSVIVIKIPTLEIIMEINKERPKTWTGDPPNVAFLQNQQLLIPESFLPNGPDSRVIEKTAYSIYKIPTKDIIKKINLDFLVENATTYEGKSILFGGKGVFENYSSPGWGGLIYDLSVSNIEGKTLMHLSNFDPDFLRVCHGGKYYVAKESHEFRIWEVPDKLIQQFDEKKYYPVRFDISFDGKFLAEALYKDKDKLVKVLDINTLQEVFTHPIGFGDDPYVSFNPDGSLVAISSDRNDLVKILSIPDGSTVAIVEHEAVEWCSFNANGNFLITSDMHDDVKVWRPE